MSYLKWDWTGLQVLVICERIPGQWKTVNNCLLHRMLRTISTKKQSLTVLVLSITWLSLALRTDNEGLQIQIVIFRHWRFLFVLVFKQLKVNKQANQSSILNTKYGLLALLLLDIIYSHFFRFLNGINNKFVFLATWMRIKGISWDSNLRLILCKPLAFLLPEIMLWIFAHARCCNWTLTKL